MQNNQIHPLKKLDGCLNTISGQKFNMLAPTPEMIDINDIAHGLAYNSHFGGQTPKFFSIAQHCLLAVEQLPNSWREENRTLAFAILMHDAAEAYVGDIIKPLKVLLPYYSELEKGIMRQIAIKLNIDENLFKNDVLKHCDNEAQRLEYETFYKGADHIKFYLSPDSAKTCFLTAFDNLKNN